jgi:hypothetical protein
MFAPLKLMALARNCLILAAVTSPLVAMEDAVAANAGRDHRGANGAPEGGVTVNDKKAQGVQSSTPLGGPKNKGSFDALNNSGSKGGGSGPTIRDHRNK